MLPVITVRLISFQRLHVAEIGNAKKAAQNVFLNKKIPCLPVQSLAIINEFSVYFGEILFVQ